MRCSLRIYIKMCTCFLFLCPSFNNPALQSSLAHDNSATASQNKSAEPCECGSLPKIATRQATKHPTTAAGSGEFCFLWSLDTVITTIAHNHREILLIKHIKDLPFTVRNNGTVRGVAQFLVLHVYPISAVLTALI